MTYRSAGRIPPRRHSLAYAPPPSSQRRCRCLPRLTRVLNPSCAVSCSFPSNPLYGSLLSSLHHGCLKQCRVVTGIPAGLQALCLLLHVPRHAALGVRGVLMRSPHTTSYIVPGAMTFCLANTWRLCGLLIALAVSDRFWRAI